MALNPDIENLYDGVYYCVHCGVGAYITLIAARKARCGNCGGSGFISTVDFDLKKLLSERNES